MMGVSARLLTYVLALSVSFAGVISSSFCFASAASELKTAAANFFQTQKWEQATESYREIVKAEPENLAAWYRLAISHIESQQGKPALEALQKAQQSPQVPPFLMYYQKARAHKLLGDDKQALALLEKAADSGYSALASLTDNPMWSDVKREEKFDQVVHKVDKTARPCVYDEMHKAFDFWLGHWEVYGNQQKTGPFFGKNHIEKQQNGCLMMEHWTGSTGSTGTSMNYYDGTKGKWVQHWVSAGGTVINMEGGLKDNSMVLTGKIFYINSQDNPVRDFKGTWTPVREGVVRQFFEESVDNGESWYPWFEGFYFKTTE